MTNVINLASSLEALQFYVVRPDNSRYFVDLREFADGGNIDYVPAKARHAWRGNFAGRPALARQFASMLLDADVSEDTSVKWRYGLREFLRFLDRDQADGGAAVSSLADVTDAQGAAYLEWQGDARSQMYRHTKGALDALRRFHKLPKLFWPARDPDRFEHQEPISDDATRALYNALKAEARGLKGMFRQGTMLALAGPRTPEYAALPDNLRRSAKYARLVADVTSGRLLDKAEMKERDVYWQLIGVEAPGPSYIAPCMGERAEKGWSAALRWFHPAYQDMAILLWLFLIGTGWNLSTALSLDVSVEANWCEPHPSNPKVTIIHAWKARADKHQFALSMTRPEWRPYQIIRSAMGMTETLRATVRYRLGKARELHARAPSQELAARIADLEKTAKSPWIYQLSNKLGEVSRFNDKDSNHLGPFIREVARRHGLLDHYPELVTLSTSDARDTWIGHAFVQSGYHVLLTQLASQHASPKTLKHYLKSRRYREHSESQVRAMQSALFGEISAGRIVDPTRLRLLVANGSITEEQESRLRDLRQRTVLGTGCLDPTDPPRSVAPDHASGALCRVQRCTGCQHGVVFAESLGPLARAYAELLQIQRRIPLASWMGSSFEDELASISETLKAFPDHDVHAQVAAWTEKFNDGTPIHDTYPSY
jgi:hypothetical protein